MISGQLLVLNSIDIQTTETILQIKTDTVKVIKKARNVQCRHFWFLYRTLCVVLQNIVSVRFLVFQ